jgi:hypothetical protein
MGTKLCSGIYRSFLGFSGWKQNAFENQPEFLDDLPALRPALEKAAKPPFPLNPNLKPSQKLNFWENSIGLVQEPGWFSQVLQETRRVSMLRILLFSAEFVQKLKF